MANMEADYATASSKHKIRIYGQFFVLQRLPSPKTTLETDPTTGIMVPVTEEYQHLPGPQLAVNYNSLGMSETEFNTLWSELGKALWHKMKDKGITR